MPEIKINEFQNKNQFKNYLIAQFYYDKIQNHINMNLIPQYVKGDVTKEELIEYCYAFAKEGSLYIDEGLTQGDTYTSELLKLKELYDKYKEEVKSVSFNIL